MNNQYLQFVREQLIIATADLSGATKVSLKPGKRMPCSIQGVTGEKIRYRDEVTGKMITRDNPPIRKAIAGEGDVNTSGQSG